MDRQPNTLELSRRTFLATTSAALVGATWHGLIPPLEAAQRHPQRGGVLQFGTRTDAAGLDSHRHNQLHTSTPAAAMYTGLTDYDQQGNLIPGIAVSWEPNKELTAWTFRLRKGVLFHNGREVDAEAVKLNIEHIKDPAIGSDWHRGAIETIERAEVLDKYTVRLHLHQPHVAVPSSMLHYPTNLQAPDNFDKASEHPIGTGPFTFVSWKRFHETRMVRFANYWETDAEGNNLPYLDEIIGKPKREDAVRLTALRTGQVHLIDALAFADVERFQNSHDDAYNLWTTHFGGIFMVFNFTHGPFQDKCLRTAAAHAIDRHAVHHSVFYRQGAMLDQPYPARLEKLERQHRRLKLAGACLLLLGSSLLLMGAFSSPARTVKAEHFALLDPRGKVRARLGTLGDHTMLSFNDQQELPRASLTVGADGFPGLVFHDQHGQVRVFLGVVDGEPILGLRDRSGTQRAIVRLDQADGAPLIFVTDTDGNLLWHAP